MPARLSAPHVSTWRGSTVSASTFHVATRWGSVLGRITAAAVTTITTWWRGGRITAAATAAATWWRGGRITAAATAAATWWRGGRITAAVTSGTYW